MAINLKYLLEYAKRIYEEHEINARSVFIGKVRYPHIGHKKVIDAAIKKSKKLNAPLSVFVTKTTIPGMKPEEKAQMASKVFNHPVNIVSNAMNALQQMNKDENGNEVEELHIFGGSDREKDFNFPNKYVDKKGNTIYNYPKGIHYHTIGDERTDASNINKHPTEMNRKEIEASASATTIIGHAKNGDYPAFKAYHPDIPEEKIKENYKLIRSENT